MRSFDHVNDLIMRAKQSVTNFEERVVACGDMRLFAFDAEDRFVLIGGDLIGQFVTRFRQAEAASLIGVQRSQAFDGDRFGG